ncbi:MAG TPA: CotH kinase family protein [Bacteroidales bacterium]|nr:CotH kinase family protein [Bacteroidales bacterium]HRZ49665.1 CotH kinase family protein [Bacteroidales bacterium]
MLKTITLCSIVLLSLLKVGSAQQTILSDSNLPILVITTDTNPSTHQPYVIADEPKVPATLKLIYRPDGSRNYLTDITNPAFLNYNGKIGIEFRGSTSQTLPKKPYGFSTYLADNTTNNNVSLLGMPSENDWVLNSLAFDPSMIRDYLSYTLAASTGNYAPRVRFVEVIVNGDYVGVYFLTEKIKIDSDRVNLVKLTTSDNTSPNVTGGYIIKADKLNSGETAAWTTWGYHGNTDYLYDSPEAEDITSQQGLYIKSVFTDLATKTNPMNSSITDGYPTIIDIPSFVDYMLIAEISSNVDAYQFSTYFHKDRGGKLRAGPVWDYNLTFGNDLFQYGVDRSKYNVWQFNNTDNTGSKFWRDLYNNSTFKCYMAKRWLELTASGKPFNYTTLANQIDLLVLLLSESKNREQLRWGTVGTQATNISEMKTWIQNRINWITTNIGSASACSGVQVPGLVISKIHYHPKDAGGYDSDDLEFIEITNHSNQVVTTTGYYIRELGISYQFPAGTSIAANQKIYLCSNVSVFSSYYGITPYGQFSRNLKNSSYHIILSDAFGNTIDEVFYSDSSPWPTTPDGDGPYLQLIDLNYDNSLASSWIASSLPLSAEDPVIYDLAVDVYPNPTRGVVNFSLGSFRGKELDLIIFNAYGQQVEAFSIGQANLQIDLSRHPAGMYLYSIRDGGVILLNGRLMKE